MNRFGLTSFLTSNLDIEEKEIALLVEDCTVKDIEKGGYVLRQHEFCKHTFFVEKGLLRQYSIDEEGKEHILSFAPENWFVTDRASAYFDQPSNFFIQALEATRVVMIDEEFIRKLSERVPSFSEFNNRLLHNHILQLQNRINLLLSARAEDRYLRFVKLYPDILLRVPQSMVASYLGIAPESLSRVRRDLAQKHS